MVGYQKTLSSNDVGLTGSHQSGLLIPKKEIGLIQFLPTLDPSIKNPSTLLNCVDEYGEQHVLRYIYYNNKLHDRGGTRNEYRISRTTEFFRLFNAEPGDRFEILKEVDSNIYLIKVARAVDVEEQNAHPLILRGWRRVH